MNTAEMKEAIQRNGVVPLKADATHQSPEIDETLKLLGNQAGAIPFYAIFPASNPNRPITLDGVFTSPDRIIEALERAGPSRGSGGGLTDSRGPPAGGRAE